MTTSCDSIGAYLERFAAFMTTNWRRMVPPDTGEILREAGEKADPRAASLSDDKLRPSRTAIIFCNPGAIKIVRLATRDHQLRVADFTPASTPVKGAFLSSSQSLSNIVERCARTAGLH
jgi:hypothetical protein